LRCRSGLSASKSRPADGPPTARESPSRARGPADRGGMPPLCGLAARSRFGQRERERERRVSDADASYYGPTSSTRTPNNAIPQRNHAKYNSLSEATRSLSQGPRQTISCRPRRRPDKSTIPDPCLFVKALFLIGQWLGRNGSRYRLLRTAPVKAATAHNELWRENRCLHTEAQPRCGSRPRRSNSR